MVTNNISGVPVEFPNEPYPTQIFMMTRIIDSLIKGGNCLLELPTGSGKTMGLLCATLAWYTNGALAADPSTGTLNKLSTKIYYGTRTHKQIQQVVRELQKTAYRHVKMDILAGRNQTCINEQVRRQPDINQSCRDSCRSEFEDRCMYMKMKKIEAEPLQPGTWNLVEIKKKIKRNNCCPYYQLKSWLVLAEIVFCPYNYILNPFIRRAMKIDLKHAVIIFDEAHNIEDICRESTSLSISIEEIELCLIQLRVIVKDKVYEPFLDSLIVMLCSLKRIFHTVSGRIFIKDDDVLSKSWNPRDFIELLRQNQLTLDDVKNYQECLKQLNDFLKVKPSQRRKPSEPPKVVDIEDCHMNNDKRKECSPSCLMTDDNPWLSDSDDAWLIDVSYSMDSDYPIDDSSMEETTKHYFVSTESINIIETFLMICQLIQEESNYQDDFSIIVTEESVNNNKKVILNLWCMNPGVAFQEIAKQSHSIILTSGTLNPMISFQKELQCQFQSVFEAPHVASASQTFLASVSRGPTNKEIQAVFGNIEKFEYKDELGRMILECCKIVPNGVLCFLSSFSVMTGLLKRWKDTKLEQQILEQKYIVVEPRKSVDMESCMAEYYRNISRGAILFAVYRGKASEGIDFADEAARLVITVGIPYPSVADPKIMLKRLYNDQKHQATEGSAQNLSGRAWYNVQAYRALNQAVGRCIRHRDDWGAMLMIDSRFQGINPSTDGLCRWIKRRKNHFNNWNEMFSNLVEFIGKFTSATQESPE